MCSTGKLRPQTGMAYWLPTAEKQSGLIFLIPINQGAKAKRLAALSEFDSILFCPIG